MIIPYVNSRLVLWAEWVLKREDGATGFPRECPYTRLVARGGGAGFVMDVDGEAMEVDKALLDIKKHYPDTYKALHLFYGVDFKNGKAVSVMMTKDMVAKTIGCHRDTVYSHLDRGHRMLLEAFHENDVIADRR